VALLSVGTETVQVEFEVMMDTFELIDSPIVEVSLPTTGVYSSDRWAGAVVVVLVGVILLMASRRRPVRT